MKKKRRIYQPRVFDSRVIMPDEIERIHKDLLQFERIEAISDPMRELIEELWPELVHKLPPINDGRQLGDAVAWVAHAGDASFA
jgi:hypothetical protein